MACQINFSITGLSDQSKYHYYWSGADLSDPQKFSPERLPATPHSSTTACYLAVVTNITCSTRLLKIGGRTISHRNAKKSINFRLEWIKDWFFFTFLLSDIRTNEIDTFIWPVGSTDDPASFVSTVFRFNFTELPGFPLIRLFISVWLGTVSSIVTKNTFKKRAKKPARQP